MTTSFEDLLESPPIIQELSSAQRHCRRQTRHQSRDKTLTKLPITAESSCSGGSMHTALNAISDQVAGPLKLLTSIKQAISSKGKK